MDSDADIILRLRHLKNEIYRMDGKVRRFLSDRKAHPYPGHVELINEIRRYENQVHRNRNRNVQLWLDNLLNSLLIYERSWRLAFDQDEKKGSEPRPAAAGTGNTPPQPVARQIQPLADKIYEEQQKKWAALGIEERESKEELAQRILPAYEEARKNLRRGERIAFVYDKKTHKVKVDIKKEER